ncbi:MAG: 50S ribosomal protein L23 [Actinomycetota bacterium]|nr:50S ribosomal protein L23 [Actinomycetota bacterium]
MKDPHDVLLYPVVSEKSYGEMEKGKYAFLVDSRANKSEIKDAVEEIFEVKVVKVNTLPIRSKPRRQGLSRGKTSTGKKAVVTLKEGQKIELFEK